MRRTRCRFGPLLRRLRNEKKMTQVALAEAAGVERNYIYYLEKGLSEPTLSVAIGLAAGLGISFTDLAAQIEAAAPQRNKA